MSLSKSITQNHLFVLGVVGVMSIAIARCHSKDLGGETPDKVQIGTELTGWDNGAGAVIQQKCANCHRADRSQTVPGNTPHILDDMGNPEFFKNAKNRGLINAMKKRIESSDVDKVMPPRFGTPLYADERLALTTFIEATIKSFDAAPKPTSTPQIDGPTPTPAAKLMFTDVQPIVKTACGECHDGKPDDGHGFAVETRADFIAEGVAASVLQAIEDRYMPRGAEDTFKDSADGKKLIEWLSGSLE
jgi:hypothetical protein